MKVDFSRMNEVINARDILVTGTRDVVFAFKYIVLENNIKLFLILY
jgi:hypothetical protein